MKFAVIDVGSNSVRLMLSDGDRTISKTVKTTRIAKGMCGGVLSAQAIERTALAVSFFYNQAKIVGADEIYVFATAAVRKAKNGIDFVRKVKELCGADVDVISGETEAELGFAGALGDNDGGVIDVGGASTEIIVRNNGKKVYSKSIYLGAVIVTDVCGQDKNKSKKYILDKLLQLNDLPIANFYSIGGTATSIAAMLLQLEEYDMSVVDGFVFSKDDLENLVDKLYLLSVMERTLIKGLQKSRAEIIANGAMIILCIMDYAGIDKITVSEKDNLEGYLISKRK